VLQYELQATTSYVNVPSFTPVHHQLSYEATEVGGFESITHLNRLCKQFRAFVNFYGHLSALCFFLLLVVCFQSVVNIIYVCQPTVLVNKRVY